MSFKILLGDLFDCALKADDAIFPSRKSMVFHSLFIKFLTKSIFCDENFTDGLRTYDNRSPRYVAVFLSLVVVIVL